MTTNPLQRELLLENYREPQNNFKPDSYTHSHVLKNLSCGDEIVVYLTLKDGIITAVNYEVRACALAIATASILSQELVGKTLVDITSLDEKYLNQLLETELTISRVKCALLPLRALQQAAELTEKVSDF